MSHGVVPSQKHLPREARLRIAAGLALGCSAWALLSSFRHPTVARDIDHLWHAARTALVGQNPYEAIGPARAFDWPWLLYYPHGEVRRHEPGCETSASIDPHS